MCSVCDLFKDWGQFSDKKARRYKEKTETKVHQLKQPKCKVCANDEVKAWREKQSPERLKDLYLKRTYGISYSEYVGIIDNQNYCCAVCNRELDISLGIENLSSNTAVVDHCHDKGHVRGILCNECNRGLGYFHDNIQSLANAISYLTKEESLEKGVAHAFYET